MLRLSPEATDDLRRLYLDGLDRFGRGQADAYLSDIYDVLDLLGRYPQMGVERVGIDPPVRTHPHGHHVFVYRLLDDGTAECLRVRHEREDWVGDLSDP